MPSLCVHHLEQSCFLARTTLEPPLIPPTQVTLDDDDDDTLHGMAQAIVPHTDRILKAMGRHIFNGDMLKAHRYTKGPVVANIGEASIQLKLRGLYPS